MSFNWPNQQKCCGGHSRQNRIAVFFACLIEAGVMEGVQKSHKQAQHSNQTKRPKKKLIGENK
jgi:hypothetical protein